VKRAPLPLLALMGTMASLAGPSIESAPAVGPKRREANPSLLSGHPYTLCSPVRALTKAERKAKLAEQRRKQRRKRRK
jgi:hypothetical protein